MRVFIPRVQVEPADGRFMLLRRHAVPRDALFRYWVVRGNAYVYEGEAPYKRGYLGARSSGGRLPDGRIFLEEMVVDIDSKEVSCIPRPLSLLPFRCYFTGGGFHLHIPIYAAFLEEEAERIVWALRFVASQSSEVSRFVDGQCISWKHAIRTIGTPSPKHGIAKSFCFSNIKVRHGSDVVLNTDHLLREFGGNLCLPGDEKVIRGTYLSRPLRRVLWRGMSEGERISARLCGRNNVIFILGAVLKEHGGRLGFGEREMASFLLALNSRFRPPLSLDELASAARLRRSIFWEVEPLSKEAYEDAVSRLEKGVLG